MPKTFGPFFDATVSSRAIRTTLSMSVCRMRWKTNRPSTSGFQKAFFQCVCNLREASACIRLRPETAKPETKSGARFVRRNLRLSHVIHCRLTIYATTQTIFVRSRKQALSALLAPDAHVRPFDVLRLVPPLF